MRMPQKARDAGQTSSSLPGGQSPQAPAKPQGHLLKLTVKLGNQPSDNQKGWLGIRLEPLDSVLSTSLGLDNANGALVLDALPNGPMSQSGIRFGDVIVALNGKVIEGTSDLFRRVAAMSPGGSAELNVWRGNAEEADFLQTLRRLAYGGNAQVMGLLGRLYATGSGVVRDDTEAVLWYRRGAEAGNPVAMTALAILALEGRGMPRDAQEGVRWLTAAADKNHLEAMHRLARLLADGKIVDRNAPEAVRLFSKAAEAGYVFSMVDLGVMYTRGDGVASDPVKAASWYKRAADLGNSAAMVNLGLLHAQGKGVALDPEAAVALYRRSVGLGNPAGMHNLAWMLDSGKGVERKSPDQAADLIMQSLERHYEFSLKQMKENSRAWSKEFRQGLQRRLREVGVYAGPTDGEFKDTTLAAIDLYFNRAR
ncbi:MAG: SEL1-like repeat protein [Hyphomicrobiaceae bacterium]|nr:SEL1-like repeat protein [Hyphomicrobiaceae bacterium]